MLDGVRAWLTAQGYRWETAKITGPLQELVERELQARLAEFGFHVDYELLTDHNKAGLFWYRQVEWLKGGNANACQPRPERARVCKTGWPAYARWAHHPYSQARALRSQENVRRRQRRAAW